MSQIGTKKMTEAYVARRRPMGFLLRQFRAPDENFHESETFEVDLLSYSEDVAVPVTDLSSGARIVSQDLFQNNEFTPPVYRLAFNLQASDLLKRELGENPYGSDAYRAKLMKRALRNYVNMEDQMLRALELQASQIFQTGTLTLVNKDNAAVFEIEYNPIADLFPTVTTPWSAAGADPVNDLLTLLNRVNTEGKIKPDMIMMGQASFERFIQNTKVQARLDLRHLERGAINNPVEFEEGGGILQGKLPIGNYNCEIWTYNDVYKEIVAPNNLVPYIHDDKVVVRAKAGRLDAHYGAVPRIPTGIPNPLPDLPTRINVPGSPDLNMHSYVQLDGSAMMAELAMRPLLVPTAMNTFGCLTTETP